MLVALVICSMLLSTSCSQIEKPAIKPYLAETAAPQLQQIRWSNGKAPKHFDPALAAAAPETDIVRAIYEGLTEIDPRSLDAIPGVAESWTATEDQKVWTFVLRDDAKWSNGKKVIADDFVRSFRRLASIGERGAHRGLLSNIIGFTDTEATKLSETSEIDRSASTGHAAASEPTTRFQQQPGSASQVPVPTIAEPASSAAPKAPPVVFGAIAKSENTLEIRLRRPDANLPKLLANPIFMPVYGEGKGLDVSKPNAETITNGPFKLASSQDGQLVLQRSDTYWDRNSVKLDKLVFVEQQNPDQAFDAYKKGQIDIVTNSDFQPLALKLMTPFKDFRRTTHGALNFYEVNVANAPFRDRRVREALALAIDREQIVDAELRGSAEPAMRFLPLGRNTDPALSYNAERAKQLLELAGYPNGEDFPKIRLVVNRNDLQQRVARLVAKTWKQQLNIETELIVKDSAELSAIQRSGEFDLIRRGVVLPSADETMSLAAILGYDKMVIPRPTVERTPIDLVSPESEIPRTGPSIDDPSQIMQETVATPNPVESPAEKLFNEDDALYDLRAIPIYFPTSYSLVKPYVLGFETNGLDAPLMKAIAIDTGWQGKDILDE
ncbi:MAG TPA: peptide ABC transporter substrate-binding protein [Pyrinomonadaceae bacterium]|nr:peptide ABC transporter substrate-binding protein [Pyrinomonadaceae bacterium]